MLNEDAFEAGLIEKLQACRHIQEHGLYDEALRVLQCKTVLRGHVLDMRAAMALPGAGEDAFLSALEPIIQAAKMLVRNRYDSAPKDKLREEIVQETAVIICYITAQVVQLEI